MTRGNFVVLYKGDVYMSIQFNGDMYPSGNGKFVYEMMKHIKTIDDLKKAVKYFDEHVFGYEDVENIEMIKGDPDFSVDYFKVYNSDYLYIKNLDDTDHTIISKEPPHEKITIKPGEIQIWDFGNFEEPDENELRFDEYDEKVIGFSQTKSAVNGNDEITATAKTLIKDIFDRLSAIMKSKYKNDEEKIPKNYVFWNKTFFTNTEYFFVYDDIYIYWDGNIDNKFRVTSRCEVTVKDIVKMYDECRKSIED